MISSATKRSILRWIHLIFTIPILGYVYSPFEELPNYAPRCSVCLRSCTYPFGILDVRRGILRHHWRRAMAGCMLPIWIWDSYPESGRAIHRAEDLVGDSCATIEKIGLIGVNSSQTRRQRETSMKGAETRKKLSPEQREVTPGSIESPF